MAFLDDVYVVTPDPEQVGAIYTSIQEHLWVHSSIRIDGGKTQVWNGAGQKPAICEVLDRVAQAADPGAKVWRGSEVPPNQQGLKIFATQLESTFHKQGTLIQRIPLVPDLQVVDPDALRQCSGKLVAPSHQSPAGAAVRADPRSEIVALFVRTLGNRTRHVR